MMPSPELQAALDQAKEREARLRRAWKLTTLVPLSNIRPTPVLALPEQPDDDRPVAVDRRPCPKCQTRGDLGCRHFRPCGQVAALAPEFREREPRRRLIPRCRGEGNGR